MTGRPDVEVRLDPAQFGRLLRDVRGFDAAFYKATRKRLRAAADPGARDVKQRILSGPSKQKRHRLRRALAAGTKVSLRTGVKTAGVSIATTGVKLPDGMKAMVRAYNKPSFRHPVGGDRKVWVTQTGRPYFGAVLDERKQPMQDAVEHALADAAATIHAAEVTGR